MPIYLNREAFDLILAQAGVSNREFAELAGVHEFTISKARQGRGVYPSTLRRIALGLTRLQKLKSLDGVVTVTKPINNKKAAAVDKTAAAKEASASGQPSQQP